MENKAHEFNFSLEEVYVICRMLNIGTLYGLEEVLEKGETSPRKNTKIKETFIKKGYAEGTINNITVASNLKLVFDIWSNPKRIVTNEGKNIRKKEFYGVFIIEDYVLYVAFKKNSVYLKYLPIMNLKNMTDLIFDYKEPARISKRYEFTYPTRDLELIINAAEKKSIQAINDFVRTTENAIKADDIYEISNLIKNNSGYIIATVVNLDESHVSSCRIYITDKACFLYMRTESVYKKFKRSTILKGMLCDCIERMLAL